MKISEALSQFNTWRVFKVKPATVSGYDLILRQFALYMKDCEIEQVQLSDITEWFNMMTMLKWDTNSFITKAMALRKFFEFFKHQGYNVVDPWLIPVPRKEFKIPRVANEENYLKLLNTLKADPNKSDPRKIRNLAIVNLLWDTGARIGELLSLNIDDINPDKMSAVIKTEKNRGSRPMRQIFWTEETHKNLLKWIERRKRFIGKIQEDGKPLFISTNSGKVGERFTIKGVGEALRRMSNRANIPLANAHSFRHHMGHQLAKKGVNNSVISSLLGHSSLVSSFQYTHLNGPELEQVYRKVRGQKEE